MPSATSNNRLAIYAGLNIAFLLIMGIASVSTGSQDPRFPYLICLFALCSSSVIDLDGWNGRYSLLGIFLAAYFVLFGVGDLGSLVQGSRAGTSKPLLNETEAVILAGGAMVVLGYRLVVAMNPSTNQLSGARDWSLRTILWVGSAMWVVGTYATYDWYVHIVTDSTNEATRKGLKSLSTFAASAYILAQMVQPLGILLIAYAWRINRARLLMVPALAIVVLQVILGFIVDIRGLAMLGGVLVIITIVLTDGRVPKLWLAGAVAYVVLVFPIFQAYRAEIHHNRGTARTTVVQNLGKTLNLALSAENRVNSGREAQTFLERSSLLGSVEIIVEKTGNEVPFEHGYTLTPLVATFVPKILWSDKPDVPTGQLVNRAFHLTDSEDIFISPSHLGELYWNFGWPGVLIGMAAIGGILGFVGRRFNLADARTITRLLVTVVTIKQMIVSFEGAIAPSYVVWLRSLAAIGLLHLIFARMPVMLRRPKGSEQKQLGANKMSVGSLRPFPNILN